MVQSRSSLAISKSDIREHRVGLWAAGGVLLCFLVSGATSLVLEGTLTRLLRFVLGNTSLAVTTVLCAYMAGLALGSYVGGRLCDRTYKLLRMYGLLEGAAGICCLLLPGAIHVLEPVYRWMYVHWQDSPLTLSLARFLLCGALLVIPATFMGATLPVLSRWYSLRFGKIGQSIAGLYAINSAGAGIGALICGFMLLPGMGVTWTLRLACGIDIAICAVILLMQRKWAAASLPEFAQSAEDTRAALRPEQVKVEQESRRAANKAELLSSGWRMGLLVAYSLSGAAAMVYEVGWTRALSLVVGSTTYAFSLMLAAFIFGLAVGSAILVRLVDRLAHRVRWFGIVELGIGLSAMMALPVFGMMPVWMVGLVREHQGSFVGLLTAEFGLMLLVMMIPTTLMGAAFPLISRAYATQAGQVGRSVGSVYAANTVGAIAGTFLTTFVLIPRMGTQNAILVAAACNVLIGAVVLWLRESSNWRLRGIGAVGLATFGGLVLFWLPPWDPAVMTSGAYIYADKLGTDTAEAGTILDSMHAGKVIFNKEDMCTAVTVRDHDTGVRTLAVGGKVDASTGDDVPTQMMLAHAPLLLHENPRNACIIGLASGMTLGAAARHDLDTIDCLEISPAVVAASHFFDEQNRKVLADPRVHLILVDGRNHLSLTPKLYDVIVSEPSNPWIAGVADLFTKEFFEICRQRLAPRGMACIWLQSYQIDDPLFRGVAGTFHDVFPDMMIVEATPLADYLLIGSNAPIRINLSTLKEKLASSKAGKDLQEIGLGNPTAFLRRIVMTGEDVAAYATGARRHTDDNALLEFAAPRSLYARTMPEAVVLGMNPHRRVDLSFLKAEPAEIASLQQTLNRFLPAQKAAVEAIYELRSANHKKAYALARQAAELDPNGPEILGVVSKELLTEAESSLQQGNTERALGFCEMASNIDPQSYETQGVCGRLLCSAGWWAKASEIYAKAAAIRPDDAIAVNDKAWLLATCPDDRVRNGAQAVEWAERACRMTEYKMLLPLATLGAAYAEAGRFGEAIEAAQKAVELARQSGRSNLATGIEQQIGLYQQGKAYRIDGADSRKH